MRPFDGPPRGERVEGLGPPGPPAEWLNPDYATLYLDVPAASTQVLGRNVKRRWIAIQNQGTGFIWLAYVAMQSTDGAWRIDPGAVWEPYRAPANPVFLWAAVAGTHVCIHVG